MLRKCTNKFPGMADFLIDGFYYLNSARKRVVFQKKNSQTYVVMFPSRVTAYLFVSLTSLVYPMSVLPTKCPVLWGMEIPSHLIFSQSKKTTTTATSTKRKNTGGREHFAPLWSTFVRVDLTPFMVGHGSRLCFVNHHRHPFPVWTSALSVETRNKNWAMETIAQTNLYIKHNG